MAVVAGESTQAGPAPAASSGAQVVRTFMRFLEGIASIPSVRRISYWSENDVLEIWVLLREDVHDDAERIFIMEYNFARSPAGIPLDLHVVALTDVDEANLPPMHTLIDRG